MYLRDHDHFWHIDTWIPWFISWKRVKLIFKGHLKRYCDYFICKYIVSVYRDECTFVSMIPLLWKLKLLSAVNFWKSLAMLLLSVSWEVDPHFGPNSLLTAIVLAPSLPSSYLFSVLVYKTLPFPLLAFTFFPIIMEVTILSS